MHLFHEKKKLNHDVINIGTGQEFKIKKYLEFIINIIKPNHKFKIKYDKNKPNGIKRKILNSKIAKSYGWKPNFALVKNLKKTILNFSKNSY